jgi:hypothetical protein
MVALSWRKDVSTIRYLVKLPEVFSLLIQKGCLRLFVTVNKPVVTADAMQVTWTEAVLVFAEETEKAISYVTSAGFRDENPT